MTACEILRAPSRYISLVAGPHVRGAVPVDRTFVAYEAFSFSLSESLERSLEEEESALVNRGVAMVGITYHFTQQRP